MVDLVLVAVVVATILMGIGLGFLIGRKLTRVRMASEIKTRIVLERKDAVARQRQVVGGKLLEKLAPYLPEFSYDPTELRFIGDPVDYVLFRGLSKRQVEEIVFLEVKSGRSRPRGTQLQIRDAVEEGHVRWEVMQVGEP